MVICFVLHDGRSHCLKGDTFWDYLVTGTEGQMALSQLS
jgi:hypothetical protein